MVVGRGGAHRVHCVGPQDDLIERGQAREELVQLGPLNVSPAVLPLRDGQMYDSVRAYTYLLIRSRTVHMLSIKQPSKESTSVGFGVMCFGRSMRSLSLEGSAYGLTTVS